MRMKMINIKEIISYVVVCIVLGLFEMYAEVYACSENSNVELARKIEEAKQAVDMVEIQGFKGNGDALKRRVGELYKDSKFKYSKGDKIIIIKVGETLDIRVVRSGSDESGIEYDKLAKIDLLKILEGFIKSKLDELEPGTQELSLSDNPELIELVELFRNKVPEITIEDISWNTTEDMGDVKVLKIIQSALSKCVEQIVNKNSEQSFECEGDCISLRFECEGDRISLSSEQLSTFFSEIMLEGNISESGKGKNIKYSINAGVKLDEFLPRVEKLKPMEQILDANTSKQEDKAVILFLQDKNNGSYTFEDNKNLNSNLETINKMIGLIRTAGPKAMSRGKPYFKSLDRNGDRKLTIETKSKTISKEYYVYEIRNDRGRGDERIYCTLEDEQGNPLHSANPSADPNVKDKGMRIRIIRFGNKNDQDADIKKAGDLYEKYYLKDYLLKI